MSLVTWWRTIREPHESLKINMTDVHGWGHVRAPRSAWRKHQDDLRGKGDAKAFRLWLAFLQKHEQWVPSDRWRGRYFERLEQAPADVREVATKAWRHHVDVLVERINK